MINESKPNVATPETNLNIGDGFGLLVGSTFKLIIGALGLGGMTNASKVSIGETWGTIASTWALETKTWEEASQLMSNKNRIENNSYDVSAITFAPETLTGAATALTLGDDSYSSVITLPFQFKYFGNIMTGVYVGSNGFIGFSPGGMDDYLSEKLPTSNFPSGQIYGFWDDLDPSKGGTIKYETFGAVGSRKFVVEYKDISQWNSPPAYTDLSTFQIMLYEVDDSIEIHTTKTHDSTPIRAVQGIESPDGVTAFTFSGRNYETFALTNDAVRFSRSILITNQSKP